VCIAETLHGSRKVGDKYSICYGSEDKKHIIKRVPHFLPSWKVAYETLKTYKTHCPTYGYWFERFMLGCHKRMGDMVVSDHALLVEIF
jgi:hypothetical protein